MTEQTQPTHETKAENDMGTTQDNARETVQNTEQNAITELEAKLTEEKNKYLYLYADFENYKKRAIKERSDLIKFGAENFAREMLSVVDNLERALEHIPPSTDTNFKQGLDMTLNQFKQSLEKQGVQIIKTENETFNPELHEAMGQEPSGKPQGAITQTLVKGYTIHGRLLRAARVVISNGIKPTT